MKFKDSTSAEWTWPKFTTRALNNVRDNCGVDLRQLLKSNPEEAGAALMDDEKLIGIFAYLCKDQIEERKLTKEAIEDRWDGETNQAARESLVEGFFRHSQNSKVTEVLMRRYRGEEIPTSKDSPGD